MKRTNWTRRLEPSLEPPEDKEIKEPTEADIARRFAIRNAAHRERMKKLRESR